jgi:hypothetical protein
MFKRLTRAIRPVLDHSPGDFLRRRAIERCGSFREKESHGMVSRADYAYGMLRAADIARFAGKDKATVCEFGVATGNGLLNMVDLAKTITAETGVAFRIVGLDSGVGLPVIDGYRDHPELWSVGDFLMTNKDELTARIDGRAELLFGDIKDTVHHLVGSLSPAAPLGFVSVDVDIYSGARSALQCLLGSPELYGPAVSIYFDDVQFFFANRFCGELLAIDEFNRDNAMRKIDQDRSLPGHRPVLTIGWYKAMYICHVLDHPVRTSPQERSGLSLQEHYALMKRFNLY